MARVNMLRLNYFDICDMINDSGANCLVDAVFLLFL